MAQVHGFLTARTGEAAERLKKSTKIGATTTTKTRRDDQEELEAMQKLYTNNATEVTNPLILPDLIRFR